jgi:hypothetical protein
VTAGNGNGNGHLAAVAGPASTWSPEVVQHLSEDLAAIEDGLRAETRTLASLEAALAQAGAGGPAPAAPDFAAGAAPTPAAPYAGGSGDDGAAARAFNTLANFRRRAQSLRDEIEGYRRRLDTLSPPEISMLLDELGEGLAEFEG